MKMKYLIEWNDDNHESNCWLDTEYLGQNGYYDLGEIIEKVLQIGQTLTEPVKVEIVHIGVDSSFPDELEEKLWDYFNTIPDFNNEDIEIFAKVCHAESCEQEFQAWYEFYEKNKEKIDK